MHHEDVRRVQVLLDEELDDAAEREAQRRGISKSALIRTSLDRELTAFTTATDPWEAITGWFSDGGVKDVDEILYGPER